MEYVSLGSSSFNQRQRPKSLVLHDSGAVVGVVVGTVKQADNPNSGFVSVPVAI